MFPRVYRSFRDFERAELRKLDHLHSSVSEVVDEMLKAELEEAEGRDDCDDGILFDQIDE